MPAELKRLLWPAEAVRTVRGALGPAATDVNRNRRAPRTLLSLHTFKRQWEAELLNSGTGSISPWACKRRNTFFIEFSERIPVRSRASLLRMV